MKKVVSLLLGMMFLFPVAGCKYNKINPAKAIYISVFNGGFGYEWLQETIDEFNAENPDTHLEIIKNKDSYTQILSSLQADAAMADVFFTATPMVKELAKLNLVEPLDDIYDMKPDGEDGKTVKEKVVDYDIFEMAFREKDHMYAMPFTDAMQGIVYDHDLFVEEGLLFTDADGTLTAGKDGIKGTYDDGLPVDINQWEELLVSIKALGIYPFLWNGQASDYLISINEIMWAQYDGPDNYLLASTYNGDYVKPSTGEVVQITPDKGYLTYQFEGKKKSIEFMDRYMSGRYFTGSSDYINPKSLYQSTSHRDAQDSYILGYKKNAQNPQSAMLFDGVWWENESRTMFDSLYKKGEKDQEYGTRDFRFMLLPNMDGGLGLDGNNNGSVMNISENGAIFVKKQAGRINGENKLKAIKKFLAYTCSDKILKRFTLATNGARPFDYSLTDDEISQLTKFGQNAWKIYSDKEHVKLVRPSVTKYVSELNYFTTPSAGRWSAKIGDNVIVEAYLALKRVNAEGYWDAMQEYYSPSAWATMYNQLA